MGFITKPSTMNVGSVVSASDIAFIYDSMSSGTGDIAMKTIEAENLYLNQEESSATSFSSYFLNLNNSDQLATFTQNPIDFTNSHINTVMKQYGLTASEELEGTLVDVGWKWGTKQASLLTCCMWDGTRYKWVYVDNFYSEWSLK